MDQEKIKERIVTLTEQLVDGADLKGEHGYSINYDSDLSDWTLTVHCKTDQNLAEVISRFEAVERFPLLLQLTFYHGMVDGISTYRREIAKMGIVYEKAYKRGDQILDLIERDLMKVKKEYEKLKKGVA